MCICARVEYLGVLELKRNLTSTEYGSINGRCFRSWGFGIKINCRFCVLCFLFFFLDVINYGFNLRYRWDYIIYFLLDVWIRFPSLRALLLSNVVAVAVSMFEATDAFLMPFWIGIGIVLKGCECRVVSSSGRSCLLHAVVFLEFLD